MFGYSISIEASPSLWIVIPILILVANEIIQANLIAYLLFMLPFIFVQ